MLFFRSDVNIPESKLHDAVARGEEGVAKDLLQKGADLKAAIKVNIFSEDVESYDTLKSLLALAKPLVSAEVLKNAVNNPAHQTISSLMYLVTINSFCKARLLLQHGATINIEDPYGDNEIDHAYSNNNIELMILLFSFGATPRTHKVNIADHLLTIRQFCAKEKQKPNSMLTVEEILAAEKQLDKLYPNQDATLSKNPRAANAFIKSPTENAESKQVNEAGLSCARASSPH